MKNRRSLELAMMLICGLLPLKAMSAIMGSVVVDGIVRQFDEKTVTLETEKGLIRIPRASVTSKNLRSGTRQTASLTDDQFQTVRTIKNPDATFKGK